MNDSYSPLSETAYYILLSLVEERHGYGIMQHVVEITKNRIKLGAGTVYGTLSKLEKSKLIVTTRKEGKRKYYQVTELGQEVVEVEINRIMELYLNGKTIMDNKKLQL